VSASVNLPLHHKVQKFSSGSGSSGWSRKKGRKTVVVVWWLALQITEKCKYLQILCEYELHSSLKLDGAKSDGE